MTTGERLLRSWMCKLAYGAHLRYGLTTPNTSPIEIHVKCLNSTAAFTSFCPPPYLVQWSLDCAFSKTALIWVCTQTYFEPGPLVCKKITRVQIRLKFIPSFTDQTHIFLTHCIPVRLSRNSYIRYPHEGDIVYLLIIHRNITSLYLFLIQQRLKQPHFFIKTVGICQVNPEKTKSLLHTHGLTTPNTSPFENTCKMPQFHGPILLLFALPPI